jgi:hypothetical protein
MRTRTTRTVTRREAGKRGQSANGGPMRSHSSFPLTADDEHCAVKFLWASFTSMVLSATAPLAPHWASEVPALHATAGRHAGCRSTLDSERATLKSAAAGRARATLGNRRPRRALHWQTALRLRLRASVAGRRGLTRLPGVVTALWRAGPPSVGPGPPIAAGQARFPASHQPIDIHSRGSPNVLN